MIMFYKIIFGVGVFYSAILLLSAICCIFRYIIHQGWKVHSWNASNDPDYHVFGKIYYKDGQEYEGGHPKYYQTFEDALLNRNPIDG